MSLGRWGKTAIQDHHFWLGNAHREKACLSRVSAELYLIELTIVPVIDRDIQKGLTITLDIFLH